MDQWPAEHLASGPPRRVVVVGILVAALAIWLVVLDPLDPGAGAQEAAVRTAILTEMTVAALPPGVAPGHVDSATLATLHRRVDDVLPTVYTGALLDLERERLSDYLDAVAGNAGLGANRDAGIDGLTIRTRSVNGDHATVTGTYSAWLTGDHWENASLTPDRVTTTDSFSAGFDRVGGRWLVSSWTDQQLD